MYRSFGNPYIWREMDRLQRDMNSLFSQYSTGRMRTAASYPAINIWSNEDGLFVHAEMPGVHVDDIDININGAELTISGQRSPEDIPEDAQYLRRERKFGEFSRTIQLPFAVDADKVDANFKDGVLSVTLPKAEAEKPKKISIKK
ncbi:MAG: Hsp20/alpha crystallin family protein [Anaerolineaceae bacterium]|jgi:HSP20 family protein|nr:Hsp20/alpha crystallin family protein [Anaerolineaceae bacterium]